MHERHYRLFIPCLIGLADSASASGTRAAQMERPQSYFVLFVGRRYYLRPILSGTPALRLLERPKGYWNSRRLWNARSAIGTPAGSGTREALLERRIAVTRVRVCDGNAMNVRWTCDASPLGSPESYARMGRGGDAERLKSLTREETFVSEAISDDCGAKLLLKIG